MGNSNASESRFINVPLAVTNRARSNAPLPPPGALVFSVMDGKMKEFKQRITAGEVVQSNATFIASSETMEVGWHVPQVTNDEILQPGQLYFVLPISYLLCPLSIHDLCDMAVKVAAVLGSKQKSKGIEDISVNSKEVNKCYPIPDVTQLIDKVDKLRLRNGTFRK